MNFDSSTKSKLKQNPGKTLENNTGRRQKVHQDGRCQQVQHSICVPKHETLFI